MAERDYTITSVLKAAKVLEALEGTQFEPSSIKRIQRRTGFSMNYCFRALKTWEEAGFAQETPRGWMLSTRLLRLSERLEKVADSER